MKKLMMVAAAVAVALGAWADTETVGGIKWMYFAEYDDNGIQIGVSITDAQAEYTGSSPIYIPDPIRGEVVIPSVLGGWHVTGIGRPRNNLQ